MFRIIQAVIKNSRFQDAAGISRGLVRVLQGYPSTYQSLENNLEQKLNPYNENQRSLQNKAQISDLKYNQKFINVQQRINGEVHTKKLQQEFKDGNNQKQQDIQFEKIIEIKEKDSLQQQNKSIVLQTDALQLQERKVPDTQLKRVWNFTKLGFSILGGTFSDTIKGKIGLSDRKSFKQNVFSENNAEKLSDAFCNLRGAPLKLAQMLSIQEENLIPPQIRAQFERARNQASIMPQSQLEQMMIENLGKNWRDMFQSFEEKPFAAASIGQVHFAKDLDGKDLAVKVQYPGVKNSIDSDLNNLLLLIKMTNFLPKQMYIEKLVSATRAELQQECDYLQEAQHMINYQKLLNQDPQIIVPTYIPHLSSEQILTSTFIPYQPILSHVNSSQETRNYIGSLLLKQTLKEIFEYKFVQTDPNPSNYFYDEQNQQLAFIDFGATHNYSKKFIDLYINIIKGSVDQDKQKILDFSQQIGFLTGEENVFFKDAHCKGVLAVGEPFRQKGFYDFGAQDMTQRVYQEVPIMLKNRLTPPPQEVYSLHRKLSGFNLNQVLIQFV